MPLFVKLFEIVIPPNKLDPYSSRKAQDFVYTIPLYTERFRNSIPDVDGRIVAVELPADLRLDPYKDIISEQAEKAKLIRRFGQVAFYQIYPGMSAFGEELKRHLIPDEVVMRFREQRRREDLLAAAKSIREQNPVEFAKSVEKEFATTSTPDALG